MKEMGGWAHEVHITLLSLLSLSAPLRASLGSAAPTLGTQMWMLAMDEARISSMCHQTYSPVGKCVDTI